jgi:uroporphyrin-III C-methyltransferase
MTDETPSDLDHGSEPEPEPARSPTLPAPPPRRQARGGRVLASIALLVSLAAAVIAAWPWYGHHLPWLEMPPPALAPGPATEPVEAPLGRAELEREVQAVHAETLRLIGETQAALAAAEQRLSEQLRRLGQADTVTAQELAQLERRLGDAIASAVRATRPGRAAWRLAEAEFLLRLANHRLLLERDAALAARMLEAADRVLAEIDDPALHPVRTRLAEDRSSLERVPRADVDGMFLRLDALKPAIAQLPLRVPEFVAARTPEPAHEPESESGELRLWEQLTARLSRLFEFRRHDEDQPRPLLGPDQALFIDMNLRLMLERAQLALLRDDDVVFASSLQSARGWLLDYLDPNHPAVRHMVAELDALAVPELTARLPDISGALTELRRYREQRDDVQGLPATVEDAPEVPAGDAENTDTGAVPQ